MMPFNRLALAPLLVLLAVFAGPAAAAPVVSFAGHKFEAQRVAFACDGSRWTKNKMIELLEELNHTVEQMAADQEFAIIFFAEDAVTAFAGGKLTPATRDNKRALANWLKDIEARGASTPIPGLTRAFEAKPDAVVFTSGGMFQNYDAVESHVDTLNPKRQTTLHAVGFFKTEAEDDSRDFVKFMRRLAERNGGASRVVYADELERKR